MPKILTIRNEEFEFPLVGENAGYGSEITDWAEAVTNSLETVEKVGSISQTQDTILNTATTFTSIPDFRFNENVVNSFTATYFVERSSSTEVFTESGIIEGHFSNGNWYMTVISVGDAKIEFNITASGQMQYKVEAISSLSYEGIIKFEASVINI